MRTLKVKRPCVWRVGGEEEVEGDVLFVMYNIALAETIVATCGLQEHHIFLRQTRRSFVDSTAVFRAKAGFIFCYCIGVDIVSDRLSELHHVKVTNSAREMKCA